MRKVPRKNYIICLIILFVTVLICLYLVALYNQSKQYYATNSALTDVLSEIVLENTLSIEENLDNYLIENSDLIVYISSGKNTKIKDFELEFKKFVVNNSLQGKIIYINSDTVGSKNFIQQIKNQYGNESLGNVEYPDKPLLILFKSGKICNIYNKNQPSVYDINWFLIENGVISND